MDGDSETKENIPKRDRSGDYHRHGEKRRRSHSPKSRKRHHRDRTDVAKLPFKRQHLHRDDFESYKALFADYLDIQKELDIRDLDEHEVKGRWKSFLNKWNRGELAEGWYDPITKEKADSRGSASKKLPGQTLHDQDGAIQRPKDPDDEEDDDYGPALPDPRDTRKRGPAIPSFQDIQHRCELEDEDRSAERADLRYERKQDRATQKERLEELAPRADPGSRERQLEKKRDTAMSNRAFAEAKEAGAEEVNDKDLLGDDGGDSYKAQKRAAERKKNEREVKKEEILRARAAEREEKLAEHRRKEAKTMDMLKSIAAQRFGGAS